MADLLVSNVDYIPAARSDVQRGLLGYVRLQLGRSLELSGVTLRRTTSGEFTLSFPIQTDRAGRRHRVVRLLDDAEREAVATQVVAILRARGAIR